MTAKLIYKLLAPGQGGSALRAARVKPGQPCGRPGSAQVSPAGCPGQPRSALRADRVKLSPGQPSTGPGSAGSTLNGPLAKRVHGQCMRSKLLHCLFWAQGHNQGLPLTTHARAWHNQSIKQVDRTHGCKGPLCICFRNMLRPLHPVSEIAFCEVVSVSCICILPHATCDVPHAHARTR